MGFGMLIGATGSHLPLLSDCFYLIARNLSVIKLDLIYGCIEILRPKIRFTGIISALGKAK